MKKLIFIFMAVFHVASLLHGQINIEPKTAVSTGLLYDLVVPLSGIGRFDGSKQSAVNSLNNWDQIYFELSKSQVSGSIMEPIQAVKARAKNLIEKELIPIGVILYNYNFLDEELNKYSDGKGGLDFKNIQIPEKLVFTSCSQRSETYNGSRLIFSLPPSMIFSNLETLPWNLSIDFGNGNGWQPIIPGELLDVSFSSTGVKTIKIKARFENGPELLSSFSFDVVELITPSPTETWAVQGEIPYQGLTTSGDAFVYLANGHTKLKKPIVVSEGIDLEDNISWEELYNLLNQENLLENLRSEGFDAVILNFHQPLNYIQQNAFLMVKLLQMVNDSIAFSTKLVTIGPSMGGLVLRYALRYMENNAIDHNTSLFISYDVPHRGANIPLGLQYLVYFYKDFDQSVALMLQTLDEPSPKQMLAYHYTNPPSSTAGSDPLFNALQEDFATIGNYPVQLRKIAVSDGRADGIGQPYQAGDQVISYNYTSFLTTLKGNVWSVKNNATGQIFQGKIQIPLIINQQLNVSVFSLYPFDNAPGGYRITFAQIDSIQAPYGDIIALHPNHCFIPTVSALDLNVGDLFYNISADPEIMSKTPFDSIYWSSENEEHVEITPYIASVVFDEIMNIQKQTQVLTLHPGWNEISSFLQPVVPEIPEIIAPIENEFVALQHLDEIYWPAGGVNTSGNWDLKKGYVIKVNEPASLSIQGLTADDKTLHINIGWNLIPVLSQSPQNIGDIFGENLSKVEIIKEAICTLIYWPAAGVFTLSYLEPGKAYYLKATESFIVSF